MNDAAAGWMKLRMAIQNIYDNSHFIRSPISNACRRRHVSYHTNTLSFGYCNDGGPQTIFYVEKINVILWWTMRATREQCFIQFFFFFLANVCLFSSSIICILCSVGGCFQTNTNNYPVSFTNIALPEYSNAVRKWYRLYYGFPFISIAGSCCRTGD